MSLCPSVFSWLLSSAHLPSSNCNGLSSSHFSTKSILPFLSDILATFPIFLFSSLLLRDLALSFTLSKEKEKRISISSSSLPLFPLFPQSIGMDLRLLDLVREIGRIGDFSPDFKRDCIDLARRISLLSHLLEEIRDFKPPSSFSCVRSASSLISRSSPFSCLIDLQAVLDASKRLLLLGRSIGNVPIVSIMCTALLLLIDCCVLFASLCLASIQDFQLSTLPCPACLSSKLEYF